MKAPVVELSENSFPVLGQNISLQCISSSNLQDIRYTWYKNEQRMEWALSQTLQLNEVTEKDNGKYQCRTEHTNQNEISQSYKLSIQGKPDLDNLNFVWL